MRTRGLFYILIIWGSLAGCGKRPESEPCGVMILPTGAWELHVTDAAGEPLGATAVPIIEGVQQDQDSSFDEFSAWPAGIQSDRDGILYLTRSESCSAPGSLSPEAWCVRVSAPGYLDEDVGVVTICRGDRRVIPVVLQRSPTGEPITHENWPGNGPLQARVVIAASVDGDYKEVYVIEFVAKSKDNLVPLQWE